MQLERLATGTETTPTFLLRVALEQAGGTAITQASIIYTLGLPGASVVSASVIVSFRQVGPVAGTTVSTGIVRCAVPQMRFQRLHAVILGNADRTACSYIAG